ncbi:MAG: hypothetical protein FWG74_09265, partial [Planctomycetes bacterium]|nr:hypothetical protein [Planctomycetota bacterium]
HENGYAISIQGSGFLFGIATPCKIVFYGTKLESNRSARMESFPLRGALAPPILLSGNALPNHRPARPAPAGLVV